MNDHERITDRIVLAIKKHGPFSQGFRAEILEILGEEFPLVTPFDGEFTDSGLISRIKARFNDYGK